jgi:Ca2+/Na+ antiporter
MIKIIICYCIKKFKHKSQIFIYFEKQYIEDIYFTLLTITIFILIMY